MNERELWWIAGLFEGEACFDVQRNVGKNRKNRVDKRARIRLKMTDSDVVARAHNIIGFGSITSSSAPGRKTDFSLTIVGKDALYLMRELEPLMGGRRTIRIRDVLDEIAVKHIDDQIGVPLELRRAV